MNSTVELSIRPDTLREQFKALDAIRCLFRMEECERVAAMFALMIDASETQDSITIHFVK